MVQWRRQKRQLPHPAIRPMRLPLPTPHDGLLMTTFAFRRRRQLIPFVLFLTACSGKTPAVDQALTLPVTTRVAAVAESRPSTPLSQQDAVATLGVSLFA